MTYRLDIEPAAHADIADAFNWYEAQRVGLGIEFVADLCLRLEVVESRPESFPVARSRIRRCLLTRFPYGIYFGIKDDLVAVIAICHTSRDPDVWRERI